MPRSSLAGSYCSLVWFNLLFCLLFLFFDTKSQIAQTGLIFFLEPRLALNSWSSALSYSFKKLSNCFPKWLQCFLFPAADDDCLPCCAHPDEAREHHISTLPTCPGAHEGRGSFAPSCFLSLCRNAMLTGLLAFLPLNFQFLVYSRQLAFVSGMICKYPFSLCNLSFPPPDNLWKKWSFPSWWGPSLSVFS